MAMRRLTRRAAIRIASLACWLAGASAAPAQPIAGVLGIMSEIAPIEARLQETRHLDVHGIVFRAGTLNGQPVVVGRSGSGKVYAAIAATVLIGHFKPSVLFFSGTAGAVDPALGLGDVVIGATVAQHDFGLQAPDGLRRYGPRNAATGQLDPLLVAAPETLVAAARRAARDLTLPRVTRTGEERAPRIVEGVIVTGDVFVADITRREELRKSLGAVAVEMEGAAVMQTCRQFNMPCLIVRGISDRADGQAMANYEALRAAASENAAALVAAIIGRLRRGQ